MKKYAIWFLSTFVPAILCILLSRFTDGFAEWYATTVYPIFVNVVARISSLFPFSVAEILIIALVLSVIAGIVLLIIKLVKSKGRRRQVIVRAVSLVMCAVSTLLMVFTLFCGINYQRLPFSAYSGLELRPSEKQEVYALIVLLSERLNELSETVKKDDEGVVIKDGDLVSDSIEAMKKLAGKYPSLDTYYPRPKGMIFSEVMSYLWISGIYIPFTIEANYNTSVPESDLPFTVCHELSHLNGFMREDEANFISFLACKDSDNLYFQYSGYLFAMIYTLKSYYPVCTSEEYTQAYQLMNHQVRHQIHHRNKYFEKYETKVAEVSTAVNNVYLKANNQTDGTRSYGRMTDLLLAYYREDIQAYLKDQ